MLNRNALRAEIIKNGYTQKSLSALLGMSEKTFNLRMKSGVFGTDEVEKMIEILKIKQPMQIFFAKEVT
jgi:hypothetical protein